MFKKIKKITKNIFFWIIPLLQFFALEFMKGSFHVTPLAIFLNLIPYFLLFAVILLLSKNKGVAVLSTSVLWCLIALLNTIVIQFRGTPATIWDLSALGTGLSVLENYSFTLTIQILFSFFIFIVLIICGIRLLKHKIKTSIKKRLIISGISLVCCVAYIFTFSSIEVAEGLGLYSHAFSPSFRYLKNGYFLSAVSEFGNGKMKKPEGYSEKEMEKFFAQDVKDAEVKPNVIVIMNEAFSTLECLGDFETNEPLTPYIDSLENAKKGTCVTSIIGGNTAVSEFEFLTGLTNKFLPQEMVAFTHYIKYPTDSVVSMLEKQGYSTNGMHPFYKEGWNRSKVYNLLGFDSQVFIEDMLKDKVYQKILSENLIRKAGFVTDEGLYKMIINQYENRDKSKPYFNFSVTIQNHGGYDDHVEFQDGKQITVKGLEDNEKLNTYLSLVRLSDTMFETLISYFEKVEEPTVILMFGDHQCNDEYVYDLVNKIGTKQLTGSYENTEKRYTTPYIAWSNYDIDFSSMPDKMSLNYLASSFFNAFDMPVTANFDYLAKLQKEYPLISTTGIIDKNGKFINDDSNIDMLNKYKNIQYYMLFK